MHAADDGGFAGGEGGAEGGHEVGAADEEGTDGRDAARGLMIPGYFMGRSGGCCSGLERDILILTGAPLAGSGVRFVAAFQMEEFSGDGLEFSGLGVAAAGVMVSFSLALGLRPVRVWAME
jgi:hypothetical protein